MNKLVMPFSIVIAMLAVAPVAKSDPETLLDPVLHRYEVKVGQVIQRGPKNPLFHHQGSPVLITDENNELIFDSDLECQNPNVRAASLRSSLSRAKDRGLQVRISPDLKSIELVKPIRAQDSDVLGKLSEENQSLRIQLNDCQKGQIENRNPSAVKAAK